MPTIKNLSHMSGEVHFNFKPQVDQQEVDLDVGPHLSQTNQLWFKPNELLLDMCLI